MRSKAERNIAIFLGLICLAFGCSYAFYQLSTVFMLWDDEGYMLLSLQQYLQHGGLYLRTYSQYGPFYFFTQQFLHSLLNLPVTHDAGRLVTLLHWIFGCSVTGLILWRITNDLLWSGVGFLSMALATSWLSHEPGHPQEIVLWLLLLPLLCATFLGTRFRAIALVGMGTAGACLLLTKINIGAFYCFAILQTFTYLTLRGKAKRVAAAVLMVITILMPRILMNHYFHGWAFRLCVFTTMVTIAGTMAGASMETEETLSGKDWLMTLVGTAGGIGAILAFAFWQGASAADLLHGIVLDPLAHPHVFHVVWLIQLRYVGLAVICLAILIVSLCQGRFRRWMERWRFVLQIIVGVVSLFWIVAKLQEGLLFTLAFLPLVLISTSEKNLPHVFTRVTIALVAAFQLLQVYPVAGTQIAMAAAPALIASLICLWDGLHSQLIAEWSAGMGSRIRQLIFSPIIPALLLLVVAYRRGVALGQFPAPPSGLAGANRVHMNPEQAQIYRQIVSKINGQCETLFTMPGMGSFNLWSRLPPPDGFNLTVWMTGFSEERQRNILRDLERSRRPCVIYNPSLMPSWMPDGTDALNASPLANYVLHDTRMISSVGDFQICVPTKTTEANRTMNSVQ